MSSTDLTKKRRRIAKACDFCHGRGIKCAPSGSDNKCKSCIEFDTACTYDRPSKRRGPSGNRSPSATRGGVVAPSRSTVLDAPWTAPHVADLTTILALVDIYIQVVYPVYPILHGPTFKAKIQQKQHTIDRAFFTFLMAVCALASARARDGAVMHMSPNISALLAEPRAEVFSNAAEAAFPAKLIDAQEFDYLRASGLLAVLCIQNGQTDHMQVHLGNYMTLVALQELHDELKWPQSISGIEREERKRLYWSMYTLEVFTATIWGGIIRCREAQSAVSYPAELDDEMIANDPVDITMIIPRPNTRLCFLKGWNYTTDLYRILEHAVDRFRRRRNLGNSTVGTLLDMSATSTSPQTILDLVGVMHSKLPSRLVNVHQIGTSLFEDHFNFQTANITATTTLLRMVLLGGELETASGEKRCQVAGELLNNLTTIPQEYLRALSSPLLFQLAGIGHILGSVMEGLSQSSFRTIRHILLRMADLLDGLETGLRFAVGASGRLRSHVDRIDQFIIESGTTPLHQEMSFDGGLPISQSAYDNVPQQHPLISRLPTQVPQRQRPISLASPLPSYDSRMPPPLDTSLPWEMTSNWPWPFDPDEELLFPDILSDSLAVDFVTLCKLKATS